MKTVILGLVVALAACGSDNKNPSNPDTAPPADGPTTPDASCFMNPTTHNEIINACTNAQKIERNVTPALLNPDGTLPELPR
jgi:hypothetical protein